MITLTTSAVEIPRPFLQPMFSAQAFSNSMTIEAGERSFRWPAGTAPLVANTDYELVLVPKVEDKTRITLKFRAETGNLAAAGDHLTLISVD